MYSCPAFTITNYKYCSCPEYKYPKDNNCLGNNLIKIFFLNI